MSLTNFNPVRVLVVVAVVVLAYMAYQGWIRRLQLSSISLPDGFTITVYSDDTPLARQLTLGTNGTVFVGSMAGEVYGLVDNNGDQVAETVHVIASGLRKPSGVTFYDGSLYVGEINRILRFDRIESRLEDPGMPIVLRADLPNEDHHGWKFLGVGPDGWLYVNVGAPCNVCTQSDERFASIVRLSLDGNRAEVYAHGVRNSVGFDWHPRTEILWFTENGRDLLGDDVPNDELNSAPRQGMHFGFPYCHGNGLTDPEFGNRNCQDFTSPVQLLGPHVASIGMRFYTGTMFPSEYHNNIFIAEHGSWNRSSPVGYRVTRVRVDGDATTYHPFATGWLSNGNAWGRPSDVLVMPDGALLVADDFQGAVYRIAYRP